MIGGLVSCFFAGFLLLPEDLIDRGRGGEGKEGEWVSSEVWFLAPGLGEAWR